MVLQKQIHQKEIILVNSFLQQSLQFAFLNVFSPKLNLYFGTLSENFILSPLFYSLPQKQSAFIPGGN